MGFSLKKAVKSVTKAVSAVAKPVEAVVQGTVNAVSNPADAVKNLASQGAAASTTALTLGQKDLVDNYTGGLASSYQGALSGNSKDIVRTGATGVAGFFGGPAAGFAVNNAFASGGSVVDAGMAGLMNYGGDVSLLNDVGSFLSSDSPLAKLANNAISGVNFGNKPKAVPSISSDPVYVQAPMQDNTKKYLMIGGGVLAVVLVAVLALKRRGR